MILTNGTFTDNGVAANNRYSYAAWTYLTVDTQPVYIPTPATDWADTTIGNNIALSLTTSGYAYEYNTTDEGSVAASFPIQIGAVSNLKYDGVMKSDTTSYVQGKPVTSASLSFYAYGGTVYGNRTITIGQITTNWTTLGTSGLSYANTTFPNIGLNVTSASFNSQYAYIPVTIDVTNIVKSWATGTNNGISFIDNSLSDSISGSATGTGNPTLTVSYWYEYPF